MTKNACTDMTCCYEMLRATSRTFALSIEQLPRPLRDPLTLAYLLLRVSDYLEDNDHMPRERKAELLLLWDEVLSADTDVCRLTQELQGIADDAPDAHAARSSALLLEQLEQLPHEDQEIIVRYVRQTTRGMARWQHQGPRVENETELDDYMHQVAGLVGYLITELFACHVPSIQAQKAQLMPLAREYGLALQTVNVIRGLPQDFERGWIFVPRSYCAQVQLEPHQLFEPQNLARAMQVVNRLSDKAERHLQSGLAFVSQLPQTEHRLRLACMWPLLFAAKTLAVSRDNPDVLKSEVKIRRADVKRIVTQTTLLGWSNPWLAWYFHQLMRPDAQTPLSDVTAS